MLETAAAYYDLWLRGRVARRSDWKLTSLAALVELISELEQQTTVDDASQSLCRELQRHLACEQVAVGSLQRGSLVVSGYSAATNLDAHSDTYRVLESALNESLLRGELGIWPTQGDETSYLLLAHQQLAKQLHAEAVLTIPLKTPAGKSIGALLIVGSAELIRGDRLPNFVRAAAPRIAATLVRRAQRAAWLRRLTAIHDQTSSLGAKLWMACLVAVVGLLVMPVPYRIRCQCTT